MWPVLHGASSPQLITSRVISGAWHVHGNCHISCNWHPTNTFNTRGVIGACYATTLSGAQLPPHQQERKTKERQQGQETTGRVNLFFIYPVLQPSVDIPRLARLVKRIALLLSCSVPIGGRLVVYPPCG